MFPVQRFIGLWPVKCARCNHEDVAVNMRSLSIGNKIYMLCKTCSKKYDELLPVLAVSIQHFLNNW